MPQIAAGWLILTIDQGGDEIALHQALHVLLMLRARR
jgi:hypothetical protein